jgi:PhnB protein
MAIPYLILADAARAIDFYTRVFGAIELVRLEAPDGKIAHAELELSDGRIMLADESHVARWLRRVSLSRG